MNELLNKLFDDISKIDNPEEKTMALEIKGEFLNILEMKNGDSVAYSGVKNYKEIDGELVVYSASAKLFEDRYAINYNPDRKLCCHLDLETMGPFNSALGFWEWNSRPVKEGEVLKALWTLRIALAIHSNLFPEKERWKELGNGAIAKHWDLLKKEGFQYAKINQDKKKNG